MLIHRLRRLLYKHLEPAGWSRPGLSPANLFISALIVISVVAAILETEPVLRDNYLGLFLWIENSFFIVFLIEYALRVYAVGEDPKYRGVFGRIRYIFTFVALVDLLVLASFVVTLGSFSTYWMRFVKVLRLLRIARLGRFSKAMTAFGQALKERSYELVFSCVIALTLLLGSSAVLYFVEGDNQEAFASVPRALWWSVATLTTVGYGDVTPITSAGKIFAGITALAGVGLIAMPTGILAAAFSDAFQQQRKLEEEKKQQG
ncbi:potassium channel protein [Aliidiomarina taiwanensis]|uniref:Potassium channel protein n=1 Tax=Aliidiomarina taiwanensis TaxID=946228 RepID=A0A432X1P4_9GAMM|nr:ion transporter [Aliidiomarina taiwanensis]RUO40091.1 potassium channel protein [Aliidiomarina taiwanensis]